MTIPEIISIATDATLTEPLLAYLRMTSCTITIISGIQALMHYPKKRRLKKIEMQISHLKEKINALNKPRA